MKPFRTGAPAPLPTRRNDPGFRQTELTGIVAGRPTLAGWFQCRAPIRGGATPEPKAARPARVFRVR